MLIKLLSILLLTSISLGLRAAPVFNAGNGHYYELHTFTDNWRLNWSEAKEFAENSTFNGAQGYLATVTDQSEDDFLWNILGAEGSYLGAFDESKLINGQWQHQAWHWVTNEPFNYTNWLPGEPNNWQDESTDTPDNEDYLMYWWSATSLGGRWNDTNLVSAYLINNHIESVTRGFVVEYPPVPLPQTAWLFASGLMLIMGRRKFKA